MVWHETLVYTSFCCWVPTKLPVVIQSRATLNHLGAGLQCTLILQKLTQDWIVLQTPPEDWIVFRMMIVTNTHKWFIQEQDIVSVGKEIESENKPTL